MNVSERIVELRKKHKLTQEEFAKRVKVTRSALSQYEIGTRNPDYETLQRIADKFNVSIDYLMGRVDNPDQEVSLYSQLTEEQKTEVDKMIDEKLKVMTEEEKKFFLEMLQRMVNK